MAKKRKPQNQRLKARKPIRKKQKRPKAWKEEVVEEEEKEVSLRPTKLTWRSTKPRPSKGLVMRDMEIVSRKGQPQVTTQVMELEEKTFDLRAVASTWISNLGYNPETQIATMVLLDGHIYLIKIPFDIWQGWVYAHSKGTYFNKKIRDKYPWRRLR